jgi:hypothetical protein
VISKATHRGYVHRCRVCDRKCCDKCCKKTDLAIPASIWNAAVIVMLLLSSC